MEDEAIETIRETSRNQLFLNRRKLKDEETDCRRSLENIRLKPSDVKPIANKLKTKASISAQELRSLQNALIDEPGNIEVFLSIHGALRGLVRELTGNDVSSQIAACGCLCNLALGDAKACFTIAKAAGVYLVGALDSLTTQLAETSAWTIGNLCGCEARARDVILAQGALAKLCDVTSAAGRRAAVYALAHLAYALNDDLSTGHLHRIVEFLSQTDIGLDTSCLLFILSCHKDFTHETLPQQYLRKIVEKLPAIMEYHLQNCINASKIKFSEQKCCELVYLIRVLANLNNVDIYNEILQYFMSNNLVGLVRKLLKIDNDESLWWLLGNIRNCCGENEFFNQVFYEQF